jgi:hypothetical protein
MLAIYEAERGALPHVGRMSEERRRLCQQRLRGGLTMAEFRAAVRRAAATPFLAGTGERGWRANFDWLIANDTNARKVLEGLYDAAAPGAAQRLTGDAAMRSATASLAVAAEIRAGAGPLASAVGARVNPAALERIRARLEQVAQAEAKERAS